MRYYIASRLENATKVKELKALLDAAGWEHTYDWTVHGSVRSQGQRVMADVAAAEVRGVMGADVVIALLPGGRGTHVEIGLAMSNPNIIDVWLVGGEDEHFSLDERTCAFYHHRYVRQVYSDGLTMAKLAEQLLEAYRPKDYSELI